MLILRAMAHNGLELGPLRGPPIRGSKYDPLKAELSRRGSAMVAMSITEIDRLVGGLPPSAYQYQAWWANEATGLDFLVQLPDDVESDLEAEIASAPWPPPENPNWFHQT